jgi:hypothetical protein
MPPAFELPCQQCRYHHSCWIYFQHISFNAITLFFKLHTTHHRHYYSTIRQHFTPRKIVFYTYLYYSMIRHDFEIHSLYKINSLHSVSSKQSGCVLIRPNGSLDKFRSIYLKYTSAFEITKLAPLDRICTGEHHIYLVISIYALACHTWIEITNIYINYVCIPFNQQAMQIC